MQLLMETQEYNTRYDVKIRAAVNGEVGQWSTPISLYTREFAAIFNTGFGLRFQLKRMRLMTGAK